MKVEIIIQRPIRNHEGRNLIIISHLCLRFRELYSLLKLETSMFWKMAVFESQLLRRKFHRKMILLRFVQVAFRNKGNVKSVTW